MHGEYIRDISVKTKMNFSMNKLKISDILQPQEIMCLRPYETNGSSEIHFYTDEAKIFLIIKIIGCYANKLYISGNAFISH
jgi:hypothetical protein